MAKSSIPSKFSPTKLRFLSLILPSDPDLERELLARKPAIVAPNSLYARQSLSPLLRFFENHSRLESELADLRKTLEAQPYTPQQLFEAIDTMNTRLIDAEKVTQFAKSINKNMLRSSAEIAIRRFDKDCDYQLSYNEFLEAVLPSHEGALGKAYSEIKVMKKRETMRVPEPIIEQPIRVESEPETAVKKTARYGDIMMSENIGSGETAEGTSMKNEGKIEKSKKAGDKQSRRFA